MFFGFDSEENFAKAYPDVYKLSKKKRVKIKNLTVCSDGKQCVGQFEGGRFLYSDGFEDRGQEVESCSFDLGSHTFAWTRKGKAV